MDPSFLDAERERPVEIVVSWKPIAHLRRYLETENIRLVE
jgi:hypothetical protein